MENFSDFSTVTEPTSHRLSAETQTFCHLSLCPMAPQSIKIKSTGYRRTGQGEDAKTLAQLLRVFRRFGAVCLVFKADTEKKELALAAIIHMKWTISLLTHLILN